MCWDKISPPPSSSSSQVHHRFSLTRMRAKESRGKHPRENKEGRGWNHWKKPERAASLTLLPQLPAPRNPIPAPGCQHGVTSGEHRSVHQQHTTHPFSLLQRSNTPISGKSEAQFCDFSAGKNRSSESPTFLGWAFPPLQEEDEIMFPK